jgi:hypothetical protein
MEEEQLARSRLRRLLPLQREHHDRPPIQVEQVDPHLLRHRLWFLLRFLKLCYRRTKETEEPDTGGPGSSRMQSQASVNVVRKSISMVGIISYDTSRSTPPIRQVLQGAPGRS